MQATEASVTRVTLNLVPDSLLFPDPIPCHCIHFSFNTVLRMHFERFNLCLHCHTL